jgi:hypothetical protein
MKNYFEKTMNGEKEENFESINSTFYSQRESGLKKSKISGRRRFKKLKFEEVEELMESMN